MKRAKENFNKQNDKFTRLLQSIQRKEKIFLEVKKTNSAVSSPNRSSAYRPISEDTDFVATEM